MPLFPMQTRVSADALHPPKSPQPLDRHVGKVLAAAEPHGESEQ